MLPERGFDPQAEMGTLLISCGAIDAADMGTVPSSCEFVTSLIGSELFLSYIALVVGDFHGVNAVWRAAL